MKLSITERARKRILSLAKDRNLEDFYFRVGFRAGGCLGLSQHFDIVENKEDDDFLLDLDGVVVIVDPKSAELLNGAQIDFEKNLLAQRFIVNFQKRKASCSCGESFSL